jgi:hypothetical protein
MRKKIKSLTTALRRQRSMATYVDAHHRAYAWADKAIAFRLAGKVDRAEAAVAKARHWLLRILALEADAARHKLARERSPGN